MIPFDENIIGVIDNAYMAGFNIPQYFFQREYDSIKDSLVGKEVYFNNPMIFIKPQGVEFSYILFWNGEKFKGGYVSINNSYSGVQRGVFERNGETLFAAHVPEIRKCYKKVIGDTPMWIAKSFVLSTDGKIYYWGEDYPDYYKEQIEVLTEKPLEELLEGFLNGENFHKPKGYVASLTVKNKAPLFTYIQPPAQSISKAWKLLYEALGNMPPDQYFALGIDNYMRLGYAQMMMHKKII